MPAIHDMTRREVLAAMAAAAVVPNMAMSRISSFADADGLGLAEIVRSKRASPTELLEWAIANAEAIDPKINCIAHKHYDEAKAQIQGGLPQGQFSGVPFLLKDLGVALGGTVTSNGSLIFIDRMSPIDSELVRRYKKAGLVIFGKSTSPEFGLGATTESKAFGQTRNPWNLDYIAGGSSGGSGAAVAAGIIPMAQGTDGGGSIRIPASCNGLFGLKPSRGRVPSGPGISETWFGLSVKHCLTRSVRDSAALLDVSSGLELGSRYTAPALTGDSYLAQTLKSPGRLRIALMLTEESGLPVDLDCAAAASNAASLCESLGHHVEEAAPVVDIAALRRGFTTVVSSAIAQLVRDRGVERGRSVTREEIDSVPWWFNEQGQKETAIAFSDANVAFQSASYAMAQFMSRFDVLLSPTLAKPPERLGVLSNTAADAPALRRQMAALTPFTLVANCTGQPAMSVPLHWSKDGLPIGVMFTGRYGEEALLLRLAAQLEMAQPWAKQRPHL